MSGRESEASPPGPDGPAAAGAASTSSQPDERHVPDDSNATLPPLEPLFTLLTNVTANSTVHPRVQYLFADDDTSALVDAPKVDRDGRPHRAIVVDLAPSADNSRWTVACASSLTHDFAVTDASLAVQQAEGESEDAGAAAATASAAAATVLRVEGVEREPVDLRPESLPGSGSGSAALGREDIDSLADEFRRRMGIIRKVVAEGQKRMGVVAPRHQEQLQPHQPRSAEEEVRRRGGEEGD